LHRAQLRGISRVAAGFQFLLVIFLSAVTRGMNFIPVLVLGLLVEFVSGKTGSVLSGT
jgi:hypothetical protein